MLQSSNFRKLFIEGSRTFSVMRGNCKNGLISAFFSSSSSIVCTCAILLKLGTYVKNVTPLLFRDAGSKWSFQ